MVEDRRAPGHNKEPQTHAGVYSVANIVTVLRLLLVPFAFSALISQSRKSDLLAFVLFSVAATTDWLDGQIARRTGTVTEFGKIIDPLVDRLLLAAGVIGLYIVDRLPLWLVVLLVVRDVYLLYGAWVLERYHLRMPVTFLGKLTTAVLLFGFALLILNWPTIPLPAFGTQPLGIVFVAAGTILSLTSALQYTIKASKMVAQAKAEGAR